MPDWTDHCEALIEQVDAAWCNCIYTSSRTGQYNPVVKSSIAAGYEISGKELNHKHVGQGILSKFGFHRSMEGTYFYPGLAEAEISREQEVKALDEAVKGQYSELELRYIHRLKRRLTSTERRILKVNGTLNEFFPFLEPCDCGACEEFQINLEDGLCLRQE